MPFPLITSEQLRARIGKVTYTEALNDENLGVATAEADLQLRRDASSKVLGRLGATYSVDVLREMTQEQLPEEVVRITLDIAVAMLAIRRPNVVESDGHRMMIRADEDLKSVRLTLSTLGVSGEPEPAANAGADVFSLDPDSGYEPEDHTFQTGFGDF